MNRRQLLGVVGGVGVSLSGCLGQGTAPAQSTDSPTPSPTPTVESQVDMLSCPAKRDSFTRETALQFATQFEKAYVIRQTLREHERVISVDVDIGDSLTNREATQTEDGWVVRFTVVGPAYRYRPTGNSTETAHVDPGAYTANYFISNQTVLRATAVEAVDPRRKGTEVTCPPE